MLFAVLGRIAKNGSYCSSDTNWKKLRRPGQEKAMPFPDIKAKMMLEAPDDPLLREAFKSSLQFLQDLTNANNCYQKPNLLCDAKRAHPVIPITHPLFEPLDRQETKYADTVYEYLNDGYKQSTFWLLSAED